MPQATLRAVPAAKAAPLVRLAEILKERVGGLQQPRTVDPGGSASGGMVAEADLAELGGGAEWAPDRPGRPSGLVCPDCHGVLFEVDEPSLLRYRCRVGHAWSSESLRVEQSEELESALWMALRSLEERAALHRKLAANARATGRSSVAALSEDRASEAGRSAEVIRQLLLHLGEEPAQGSLGR